MDKAILLTKLATFNDDNFEPYRYYLDATSNVFEDEKEEFDTCIVDLKKLVDCQYDFAWLSENATTMGCNRREFKALCDDVCVLLGNRIDELCKHTRNPIFTKPSKFEDYCPFANEVYVVYGNGNETTIKHDGKVYKVIETKLESTTYYNIYISQLDI